jgi:hypothetical protein
VPQTATAAVGPPLVPHPLAASWGDGGALAVPAAPPATAADGAGDGAGDGALAAVGSGTGHGQPAASLGAIADPEGDIDAGAQVFAEEKEEEEENSKEEEVTDEEPPPVSKTQAMARRPPR